MNPWPPFSSFHNSQLLVEYQVLGSQIRSDSECCPNECCEAHEYFYHEASFTGRWKFVNDFRKYVFFVKDRSNLDAVLHFKLVV